jgi:hypothetical protein
MSIVAKHDEQPVIALAATVLAISCARSRCTRESRTE